MKKLKPLRSSKPCEHVQIYIYLKGQQDALVVQLGQVAKNGRSLPFGGGGGKAAIYQIKAYRV